MNTVTLGKSELQVSRLCLGSMQFGWTADEARSFEVMDAFAEAGGNFIDSADVYSNWVKGHAGGESEEIIGRWMKARGNRGKIVVATKVRGKMWDGADGEGLSRDHIMRAAEDSLRRLQVETIDLYQCHWFDDKTPIEETLRAFEDLVKQGKVRYIGASNYQVAHLSEALNVAREHQLPAFVSLQPHHSLVHRQEFEDGLQAVCLEHELAVIPYSPLAAGFLTGKYTRDGSAVQSARSQAVRQYMNEVGWRTVDAVRAIASGRQTSPSSVALAWSLAQPGIVAPIVGANSVDQLAEQLPAVQLALTAEELRILDQSSQREAIDGTTHPGR